MANITESLNQEDKDFITKQKMFFVSSSPKKGKINLSPKGLDDTFKIIDDNTILWLNYFGSGNETAAHLLEDNRMTIMFCAFEGKPMILRLYGEAKIYHKRNREFYNYINLFPENVGARQIIEMDVNLVQTSCGFAVPFMEFREDRTTLNSWAEKQGKHKIEEYWKNKNTLSIDGFETKILED